MRQRNMLTPPGSDQYDRFLILLIYKYAVRIIFRLFFLLIKRSNDVRQLLFSILNVWIFVIVVLQVLHFLYLEKVWKRFYTK